MEFEIFAIDKGAKPHPLTGSASIIITVGDLNDARPEFVQDFYSLEVASDEDIGHLMVTMNATDVDSRKPYLHTYSTMLRCNHAGKITC